MQRISKIKIKKAVSFYQCSSDWSLDLTKLSFYFPVHNRISMGHKENKLLYYYYCYNILCNNHKQPTPSFLNPLPGFYKKLKLKLKPNFSGKHKALIDD